MRIGFVGTGRIAEAVVTGLCTVAAPPEQVLLSPRNAAIAQRLATRFSAVRVAADNQAVIAGSEVVALSVRPAMAEEILRPLAFRPGQRVLSLMALVPLARVRALVDPAEAVRVLPLPTAARREGPVVLYPAQSWAQELLAPLGELVLADSEMEIEALWSATGLIAAQYEQLRTFAEWLTSHGVPPARADRYGRSMVAAITAQAATSDISLTELRAEAQTPGGLNEQALRTLQAAGVFAAISTALDQIAARLAQAHKR
jgi:pyrroline-5-carboxylate reductase